VADSSTPTPTDCENCARLEAERDEARAYLKIAADLLGRVAKTTPEPPPFEPDLDLIGPRGPYIGMPGVGDET